ncbi:MAG: alpha/beta hydrolase [Bacteroidales bacterium]
MRWFTLTSEINPLLKFFTSEDIAIPTLFIMGEEDYLFLPTIKQFVKRYPLNSKLVVVPNTGHVVNVEKPEIFNQTVIDFINGFHAR